MLISKQGIKALLAVIIGLVALISAIAGFFVLYAESVEDRFGFQQIETEVFESKQASARTQLSQNAETVLATAKTACKSAIESYDGCTVHEHFIVTWSDNGALTCDYYFKTSEGVCYKSNIKGSNRLACILTGAPDSEYNPKQAKFDGYQITLS